MEIIQSGAAGAEVKEIQRRINEYFKASIVAEDGKYGAATTKGVKQFQEAVKLNQTGTVDVRTMALLKKPPETKVYKYSWKQGELLVPHEDHDAFLRRISQASEQQVKNYRSMAQMARISYDLEVEAGKSIFYRATEFAGGQFSGLPNESIIKAAEAASTRMQAALKVNDLAVLVKELSIGGKNIEAAANAMSEYRSSIYAGGDRILYSLKLLRDGCVETVEILAAFATGGSSIAVTASVMGAVGSYKALLPQIEKAISTGKVDVPDAIVGVLRAGAIEALVGALLRSKKITGTLAEKFEKYLAKELPAKFASKELILKLSKKALEDATKGALEKAVKQTLSEHKPGEKLTSDEFSESVKDVLVKVALGALGDRFAKELAVFQNQGCAKVFKGHMFKGLGKVHFEKAYAAGGDKIIEDAVARLLKEIKNPERVEGLSDRLAKEIAIDPKANADLAKLVTVKKLSVK